MKSYDTLSFFKFLGQTSPASISVFSESLREGQLVVLEVTDDFVFFVAALLPYFVEHLGLLFVKLLADI